MPSILISVTGWAFLALLIEKPVLILPRPVAVEVRYTEDRVFIDMAGEIQDPVKVYAPRAREIWINNEKMSCWREGGYRMASFPILHNQESCEPH
jgi:hypothetical protein